MKIYDHCWWYTQLPLDKFTQKCSQYKKKKVLVGPRKSCSILLKIARNTKKSIGGPRQILLNFAQFCSKLLAILKKVLVGPGKSCSIWLKIAQK